MSTLRKNRRYSAIFLRIIPARGGSTSFPGKSIARLNEKLLIAHTIGAAKASRFLSNCLISTDADKIASIAKNHRTYVPFHLPAHLAWNILPTWPSVQHAVSFWRTANLKRLEGIALLQPTSPLLTGQDIDSVKQRDGNEKI